MNNKKATIIVHVAMLAMAFLWDLMLLCLIGSLIYVLLTL